MWNGVTAPGELTKIQPARKHMPGSCGSTSGRTASSTSSTRVRYSGSACTLSSDIHACASAIDASVSAAPRRLGCSLGASAKLLPAVAASLWVRTSRRASSRRPSSTRASSWSSGWSRRRCETAAIFHGSNGVSRNSTSDSAMARAPVRAGTGGC